MPEIAWTHTAARTHQMSFRTTEGICSCWRTHSDRTDIVVRFPYVVFDPSSIHAHINVATIDFVNSCAPKHLPSRANDVLKICDLRTKHVAIRHGPQFCALGIWLGRKGAARRPTKITHTQLLTALVTTFLPLTKPSPRASLTADGTSPVAYTCDMAFSIRATNAPVMAYSTEER